MSQKWFASSVADELLEMMASGVQVDVRNDYGQTKFQVLLDEIDVWGSSRKNWQAMIKVLLAASTDIASPLPGWSPHMSALMLAVVTPDEWLLDQLGRAGADVTEQHEGLSLHHHTGSVEVMKMLLFHGLPLDLLTPNGETLLHTNARRFLSEDTLAYLIDQGLDVTATFINDNGESWNAYDVAYDAENNDVTDFLKREIAIATQKNMAITLGVDLAGQRTRKGKV